MAERIFRGLAVLGGVVAVIQTTGLASPIFSSWKITVLTIVLGLVALAIFITSRHLQLQLQRLKHPIKLSNITSYRVGEGSRLSGSYFFIVLGSGGHTKEMLAMMGNGFPASRHFHRRYLISSGDTMSVKHLEAFELDMKSTHGDSAGTWDKYIVPRARRIHQSLLTTPFTALWSTLQIFPLLLTRPVSREAKAGRFPNVVVTNGPATGFFVGLAVYVLKVFYIVPEDVMQVLFIESWARIHTLSITGKLFHYTGIADSFLVQHEHIAKSYGVLNGGSLVVNGNKS